MHTAEWRLAAVEARARELSQGREAELASMRGLARQAEEHAGAYKRERDELLRRLTATEVGHRWGRASASAALGSNRGRGCHLGAGRACA